MRKRLLGTIGAALLGFALAFTSVTPSMAYDTTLLTGRDQDEKIDDKDREAAYVLIIEHMDSLRAKYDLSDAAIEKMNAVFYQANVYIATSTITRAQLQAYVGKVKSDLTAVVGTGSVYGSTSKFLFLTNEVPVTSAVYGQQTTLIFSLINLGKETVSDVVITPTVSTDPKEWPFVIQTGSDVRTIPSIAPASSAGDAFSLRQEATWNFVVRNDVKTGTYPLKFHVQYYRNGALEDTDLTTYVNITGPSNTGALIEPEKKEETGKTSTPRIIVTGFTTNPEVVSAGDTFDLTITVQNTSSITSVSNIQFDLAAAPETTQGTSSYAAFLPTSGSATIYVPYIAAGATQDVTIEMTARSDLSQKPYVVQLSMNYEDSKANPYTATSDISIPVHQEGRMQVSNMEISPESAMVGDSVNVMFDINNLGRTTLYNVQVKFVADSVSGGDTFIGNLDSGKTGSVDAMVNCAAATMDDGTVPVIIYYEDEAGVESQYETSISLYVSEPYYEEFVDDGMYDDGMMMEDPTANKKPPVWVFALIGVAVVAVIVIIIVVSVKKSKKKKAELLAKLAEEDDTI